MGGCVPIDSWITGRRVTGWGGNWGFTGWAVGAYLRSSELKPLKDKSYIPTIQSLTTDNITTTVSAVGVKNINWFGIWAGSGRVA
jgi:hypothetical protein